MNKEKKERPISFVAGRSGGHIIPGLIYGRQQHTDKEIIFFSTATRIDKQLLQGRRRCTCFFLSLGSFPGKYVFQYPIFVIQLLRTFFQSIWLLRKTNPFMLISMGGYISIPVVFAAKILRIPVTLFELNTTPGRAIRFLTPFADNVYICFKEAQTYFPAHKVSIKSYPLRFNENDIMDQEQAKHQLGLPLKKKTLLILGGSQGSQFLNALMQDFVLTYPDQARKLCILHQTGNADEARNIQEFYETNQIFSEAFAYRENMLPFYCAADALISRAGAGTLFEITFFKKPAIIVPLETASTDHQLANAKAMQQKFPYLLDILKQSDIEQDRILFFSQLLKHICHP